MMTRDEVKRYIELHGDAEQVISTIKEMKAKGMEITEQNLDELLSVSDYNPEEEEEFVRTEKRPSIIKVVLLAVGIGAVLAVVGVLLIL